MSFITDIIEYGLGRAGVEATGDTPRALLESAAGNFLKDKVNAAFKRANIDIRIGSELPTATSETLERIEREVKTEFKADTNANIPVVYGDAWCKPLLVDAVLTNNNCTMWYCVVLSEMTGTQLSTGTDSTIEFREIILNDRRMVFDNQDGVTLRYLSGQGSSDSSVGGTVKVYPYAGGSDSPVPHSIQFPTALHGDARTIMPGWTAAHAMSDLVFALIRVDYDREVEITGIGGMKFKLRNSMTLPGDVLYDYMTNSVYGAGLAAEEIDQ